MGGVYYHVEWPLIKNTDLVVVDSKISCPPKITDIQQIITKTINQFKKSNDDLEFFNEAKKEYEEYVVSNYEDEELIFPNSSRYHFDDGNLTMKFNRFGHGMDPERGMLVFWSQKLASKPIVKFVVQRENRDSYRKLYEGSRLDEILQIVDEKILANNNDVSIELALQLFKKATNTEYLLNDCIIKDNVVNIDDDRLLHHLNLNTSVFNSLLHFSSKIVLKDLQDNTIVEFRWNNGIVDRFYNEKSQNSLKLSNEKMPLREIANRDLNEDVVTYSCMKVFENNHMINIAVSYPGAQGDRKILYGSGTEVKRDYIDIISIKETSVGKYTVLLHENKRKVSDTQRSDIDKLYNFRNNPIKMVGLNELIKKVYDPIQIDKCYIGIGGEESPISSDENRFDYLINVNINSEGNVDWNLSSSNKDIIKIFNNEINGTVIFVKKINIVC